MIGRLRHRVTIQARIETADGGGGNAGGWQDITTAPVVWASIISQRGSTVFDAGKQEQVVTHKITMRHRTDLTPGMRIVKGVRIFEIVAILDFQAAEKFLTILTEEKK